MATYDPLVFLAVFQEMMGPLLYILLAIAIGGLAAFVWLLMREKGLNSKRLIRSEVIGVVGGFAALAIMAWVTVSGFTDAGGPVDWLLICVIWGVGLVGTTILAYTVQGLLSRRD